MAGLSWAPCLCDDFSAIGTVVVPWWYSGTVVPQVQCRDMTQSGLPGGLLERLVVSGGVWCGATVGLQGHVLCQRGSEINGDLMSTRGKYSGQVGAGWGWLGLAGPAMPWVTS